MSCASRHPGTLFWLKARWRGASEEPLVLSHGTQPLGKDLPSSNFPHALLMEARLPFPPTETPLETNPPFKNDRLTFTGAFRNWFSPKLDLGVYYRAQWRINKSNYKSIHRGNDKCTENQNKYLPNMWKGKPPTPVRCGNHRKRRQNKDVFENRNDPENL